jgi:hypothetical protein
LKWPDPRPCGACNTFSAFHLVVRVTTMTLGIQHNRPCADGMRHAVVKLIGPQLHWEGIGKVWCEFAMLKSYSSVVIMQVVTLKRISRPLHLSSLVQAYTGYHPSTSIFSSSNYSSSFLDPPLMNAGSHADASVPIGGYLCPSCSIRGPHVHHCSSGTLSITPATCLPQPHQVVLSEALSGFVDFKHKVGEKTYGMSRRQPSCTY